MQMRRLSCCRSRIVLGYCFRSRRSITPPSLEELIRGGFVLTRDALMPLVIDALNANGGCARVVDVPLHLWEHHENQLRESGDLLYTWQYDVRWAAQKLRNTRKLKAVHKDRSRPWEPA